MHFFFPRPSTTLYLITRITCSEEYKSGRLRKMFEPKREEVAESVRNFHNQELRDC